MSIRNFGSPSERPLLLVDVDGVISLFGFEPSKPPAGSWQMVDGIAHFLSATVGAQLRRLSGAFELAWCTGWEEKANEYLPLALGLERPFPHLSFAGATPILDGHWKLTAIDRYAGSERPLAWIDDAHDERCRSWAQTRPGPTLLISTDPAIGLTDQHVARLIQWASALDRDDGEDRRQPQGDRRPASPGVA
jgi:Swiss Army Knife RNA repair-like protein